MDRDDLNVADLKLDQENPRHEPAKSQRDIVHALLSDGSGGAKLLRLAEDIATNGLSPIDVFLVLRETGPSYVVLEGNRRIASVKLLANPDLTAIPKYQKRFRDLKKKMAAPIHTVPCAIVDTREEGKHWQELRHTGEREGRGVVPWDTAASTRFHGRRGSQADRALNVLDALQAAFPRNAKLQDHIKDVRKNKLTTFGRLVSDPFVRQRFGVEISPSVVGHYPSELVEPGMEKVLGDLHAGSITVSGLKSKDQRRKYVLGLGAVLPDEAKYETDPRPLVPAGTPRPPAAKPKPAPKPTAQPVKPLFDGVQLTNLGSKIADILVELQRLDVDAYPNACGALLRVVVELAVTEVHVKKGWPYQNVKLKDLVKMCVKELDPTEKDTKYQPVRAGLNDGTSMFAVATIHAFLHNPHYKSTPSEIRSISSNYAPFLAGLDTLV